jgi:hypothetical protein
MSAHTPGPWEVGYGWVQTVAEKTPVANFNFYAATEANKRLIAAAPELLQALRRLLDDAHAAHRDSGFPGYMQTSVSAARAAIAKAEGKA